MSWKGAKLGEGDPETDSGFLRQSRFGIFYFRDFYVWEKFVAPFSLML